MIDTVAAKRMEGFAQTILNAPAEIQEKMWEALEPILTAEEIDGLKAYVGLFHMMTDEQHFNDMKESVCEQYYAEANK